MSKAFLFKKLLFLFNLTDVYIFLILADMMKSAKIKVFSTKLSRNCPRSGAKGHRERTETDLIEHLTIRKRFFVP